MLKKIFYLILLCLIFVQASFSQEQQEDFTVEQADNLEITDDKIILEGNVLINSKAESNKIKLKADKIILLKNSNGQFSNGETFGYAEILSEDFSLKADKIYLKKEDKTLVEAIGNVWILSKDKTKELKAPKVIIDTEEKLLKAFENVETILLTDANNSNTEEKQKILITSEEQEIDLQNKIETRKLLIARGNAILNSKDGELKGELIEIFAKEENVEKIVANDSANLKQDVYTIKSDKIEIFNNYTDKNILVAEQNSPTKRAELTSPQYYAQAEKVILVKYKAESDSGKDELMLFENAEVKDLESDKTMQSSYINIPIKSKNLSAGLGSRTKGHLNMKKK